MRFTLNSTDLSKALSQIAPAIGGNRIIPILDNFLLKIKDGRCEVTATNNLTITITSSFDCQKGIEVEACLPYNQIKNISALISAPMDFSIEEQISIKAAGKAYKLGKVEDAANYPKRPVCEALAAVEVDGDFLYNMQMAKNYTLKGINEFDSKTWVWVDVQQDGVNVLATDSHILFRHKQKQHSKKTHQCLFDGLVAQSVKGLGSATMSINEKYIQFDGLNISIIGSIGTQRVPNYNIFYPAYESNCQVDKNDLQSAINSIKTYESLEVQVRLTFKKGKIGIYFHDALLDRVFEEDIPATHSVVSEPLTLNVNNLNRIIQAFPSEDTLNFYVESQNKPVHLDSADKSSMHIIMPMAQQP